jgi:hypothetical protein
MKKLSLFILVLILMSCIPTHICYANSAEPPSILIIVPNAPNDLEISIGSENKAFRTDKGIESYFTFYSHQLKFTDYTLKITTGNMTFDIMLDTPLQTYNNIFTLDLESQTLTPGKLLSRSISLFALRLILTLIIEAVVFFLFGYRKKRSWMIFLIINLITQGALYIWLNGLFTPLANGYIILTLIFGEILVFTVEMSVFLTFIKEHHRLRTALFVIAANLFSLIAGGYLITTLPV